MYELSTPVVFLIFRRPDTTQRVFERIAQAKPKQLFVVADGPRTPEEAQKCQEARAIINQVDWDCEVHTNYADQNMGLRRRISSGLNWVFEQVEQAIILEDDCLPHPTFFRYCKELLEKYQDNERVMHISGDNFGYHRPKGVSDSYYFSMFAHVWGWATWRRAWAKYDVDMTSWGDSTFRETVLSRFPKNQRAYWRYMWNLTYREQKKTWAFQWVYACVAHEGLCVMPYENQITNIGMGAEGTNTKNSESSLANLYTSDIYFPLEHPTHMIHNSDADALSTYLFFRQTSLLRRLKRKVKMLWMKFTKS